MQKSKIEWCDYTINPIKGLCPVDCKDNQGKSYCYARRMYKRFKWYEGIEWDESCLHAILKITKPSRIFVGSTMELFGGWIHKWALESIFAYCRDYPQHTFIFLTKQPQTLARWSPFPENCHIGISVASTQQYREANNYIKSFVATVKFVSLEPLLGKMPHEGLVNHIQQVIIGQQTPASARTAPKVEWIKEIVESADRAGVPVFLKNNLKALLPAHAPFVTNPLRDLEFGLRQEMPESNLK